MGVVAWAKVQDRHPISYLVRVWDEGAWTIFDRSPLGSAVPWRVSVDGGAPSPAGESLVIERRWGGT